jgi:hypothetical protein
MTVQQLIEELSKYNPNDIVIDGEEEEIKYVIDWQWGIMIESDYKNKVHEHHNG